MRKHQRTVLFLLFIMITLLFGFEYAPTEEAQPDAPAPGFAFTEADEAQEATQPPAGGGEDAAVENGEVFPSQEEPPEMEESAEPEAEPRPREVPVLLFDSQALTAPTAIRNDSLVEYGRLNQPPTGEASVSYLDLEGMSMMSERAAEYWAQVTIRLAEPAPNLLSVSQDVQTITGDEILTVSYQASTQGQLLVYLINQAEDSVTARQSIPVEEGSNAFQWKGTAQGTRVGAGNYTLVLTLRAGSGQSSKAYDINIGVDLPPEQPQGGMLSFVPSVSAPYSAIDDGTFWSMSPGELDDEKIWEVLMQLITVYDGGLHGTDHVYLKSNPDGTGDDLAQIHARSQGLHVIGEVNEYGYVLVEAFSNYDLRYYPKTDEEKAAAFTPKQGYVEAKNLITLNPQPDIGFVVDKLTQRMYMFMDGKRVSEFIISTGNPGESAIHRETIPGEFITVSHVGGYWSNELYSDFSIRFNGGTLMHEVPFMELDNGSKHYGYTERALGTKASAGCVRVPYKKNEEGYNMEWIYNTLKREGRYKIIIWDDQNRLDSPTTWR